MQILLSLPPSVVAHFAALEGRALPEWVPVCDPPGRKLGSGGGTAHLLAEAWARTGDGATFDAWLQGSRKLMLHAGGQSRRLPAYAATGKALAPMPVLRWGAAQRLDQSLLDLQLPLYQRLLERAAPGTVAMVAAGDVLLLADAELPELPAADIVGIGLWVAPEQASHHGVFFCPRRRPEQLSFFLQKPAPATVRELAAEQLFLVDTGVWLFSGRALAALLAKTGWDPAAQRFTGGVPRAYELYAEFGLGLGTTPTRPDPDLAGLTTAIVALPGGQFHHFGSSREMIQTTAVLQNLELDQRKLRGAAPRQHPDSFILNADFRAARPETLRRLWVENSCVAEGWNLTGDHVITGVPANQWRLRLTPGQCLDVVPVTTSSECWGHPFEKGCSPNPFLKLLFRFADSAGSCRATGRNWDRGGCLRNPQKVQKGLTEGLGTAFPQKGVPNITAFCVRIYGLDDLFRGPLDAAGTLWLGQPAARWFAQRGLDLAAALRDAGGAPGNDIQDAPLFPVLAGDAMDGDFVQWLFDANTPDGERHRAHWLALPKLSAAQLGEQADLPRLYAQRRQFLQAALPALFAKRGTDLFDTLDLAATARLVTAKAEIEKAESRNKEPASDALDFGAPTARIHTSLGQRPRKETKAPRSPEGAPNRTGLQPSRVCDQQPGALPQADMTSGRWPCQNADDQLSETLHLTDTGDTPVPTGVAGVAKGLQPADRGNATQSLCHKGDFAIPKSDTVLECGNAFAALASPRSGAPAGDEHQLFHQIHARMFEAAVQRRRGAADWQALETEAFQVLREAIVASIRATPVRPHCAALEDQIVWGRAPLRLDLAGGWTDTPPYCLRHGGRVVNAGVELNGQPAIQVFVHRTEKRVITLRSIDLGLNTQIRESAELRQCQTVGDAFSIPKAALALAGFLPEFGAEAEPDLAKTLNAFGGGLDITFLAAVPKGSGLGTSSILAATLLGTLGDACGLAWDTAEISRRTLALEQLLTTGGGWQDQVGGITRGLKEIVTQPGLAQTPEIRWLPPYLFNDAVADGRVLLYYTGITRVAKSILQEIVRGMFLNSAPHLRLLSEIGGHARQTYETLLRGDWDGWCRAIRRSWELNQQLDPGTNPPAVQEILARIQDWTAGAKLLGAGGGGYLLLLAKDAEAARRLRAELTQHPPNAKARFVTVGLSNTGLQMTRS